MVKLGGSLLDGCPQSVLFRAELVALGGGLLDGRPQAVSFGGKVVALCQQSI